jgi:cytochrome o ubiquinol oxidase subunit 3
MSTTTVMEHHDHHGESNNVFGFWIYIMSDCVLFASIFAAYAVLFQNTYGGPGPKELASIPFVFIETMILLTSSFTYGLAMLCIHRHNRAGAMALMLCTFILGVSFITMELSEFSHLVHEGDSWQRSAFLSSFFTLVGTHGLHVFVGLVWMVMLFIQLGIHGIKPMTKTKLTCLGLFWHFLDIVWIFVFSIVYLMGAVLE